MFETTFIVAMLLFIAVFCFILGIDMVYSRWSDRMCRAMGWLTISFGIFLLLLSGFCVFDYWYNG